MKNKGPMAENWTRRALIARTGGVTAALGLTALGVYGCSGGSGNGAGQSDAALDAIKKAVEPTIQGDVAAMAIRNPSEDIGALSFNNGDGTAITMAETGAKVRLVNLWATWCAPCREEMPYLEQMQADRGGDAFEVVAISVDGGGPEKPRNFYTEIGLETLPFYHDPTIGVFTELKETGLAFGLPVTLLIDPKNRVIANMNGPAQWASPDAFAMVDAAIAAAAAQA
ncbi:MAG: TlpA disulfide reductase family protein, partial [Pseudomonadota bacterium]